jgi:DNA replication initiation complex subunit (GINS family)
MYDEFYGAWRVEVENPELGRLTPDFYSRAADYLRRIRDESQLLDKKTVKATLLERELENAQRMVYEVAQVRYRKIMKQMVEGRKVPMDLLTAEETKLCSGVLPSADGYTKFTKSLLLGQITRVEVEAPAPMVEHKRVTLRFLKQVPSIIGGDMKTYGPFLVEDVASVPLENARILIKQHLAEAVEVS